MNKKKIFQFIENCENSPEFWIYNAENYPYLYKTALGLCSINSSSAFIERFFSISGVINDCRRGNLDKEIFLIRAFLGQSKFPDQAYQISKF